MAAKNKFLNAMKMPSIDDMFSSEADRQRESGDLVTEVPLSELHPFVGHPFEVRDDEDMQKLVDSIRENGVLTNLTVRRRHRSCRPRDSSPGTGGPYGIYPWAGRGQ